MTKILRSTWPKKPEPKHITSQEIEIALTEAQTMALIGASDAVIIRVLSEALCRAYNVIARYENRRDEPYHAEVEP